MTEISFKTRKFLVDSTIILVRKLWIIKIMEFLLIQRKFFCQSSKFWMPTLEVFHPVPRFSRMHRNAVSAATWNGQAAEPENYPLEANSEKYSLPHNLPAGAVEARPLCSGSFGCKLRRNLEKGRTTFPHAKSPPNPGGLGREPGFSHHDPTSFTISASNVITPSLPRTPTLQQRIAFCLSSTYRNPEALSLSRALSSTFIAFTSKIF